MTEACHQAWPLTTAGALAGVLVRALRSLAPSDEEAPGLGYSAPARELSRANTTDDAD